MNCLSTRFIARSVLSLALTTACAAAALPARAAAPAITPTRVLKPLAPLPVDTCSLYLTQHSPADPDLLKRQLPALHIAYSPSKANWQRAVLIYGPQTVTLTREVRPEAVMRRQKALKDLIQRLDPDKRLKVVGDLYQKAHLLKQVVTATSSDPDDPEWAQLVSAMAQLWRGTLGYRDELLDTRLRVLLARDSDWEEGSEVPYFQSALARRLRSESELQRRRIQIYRNLPPLPAEEELVTQPARQIFERGMTLLALASTTTTLSRQEAFEKLRAWGLVHELSRSELAYLTTPELGEQDRALMNQRFESAYALMWSIGLAPDPGFPSRISPLDRMLRTVQSKPFSYWLHQARLRPASQLLDRADLMQRLDWAVRSQQSNDWAPYKDVQPMVVAHWRHALDWVIRDHSAWDTGLPMPAAMAPDTPARPADEPVTDPALEPGEEDPLSSEAG